MNWRNPGTDYDAQVDIYLEEGNEPILIRTRAWMSWLGANRSEREAAPVVTLYREMASRTYKYRLANYVEQIESHGYFHYDKKLFFKTGVVTDGKRSINILVDRGLLKSAFEVSLPAPKTAANQLKNLFWKRQDFVIRTEFDADVFFRLLEHYYNLKWAS